MQGTITEFEMEYIKDKINFTRIENAIILQFMKFFRTFHQKP